MKILEQIEENVISLKIQKEELEKIIKKVPTNNEQKKVIKEAKEHLNKINNILKIWEK